MAQLVRKTNDIILHALYLIGELGVEETPDAFMMEQGIELINEVLDNYNQDNILIPYQTTHTFDFVASQSTYSVSDIISSPTVNANRILDLVFANYTVESQVTYPLNIVSKAEFYEITRLTTLDTRPGIIFLDKQADRSNLVVYPNPDQGYECKVILKSMLDFLSLGEDISGLPPNYYGLLKYSLARKFQLVYPSAQWSPVAEQMYQELYENAKNSNETDLTIRPSDLLTSGRPAFWWTNILAI